MPKTPKTEICFNLVTGIWKFDGVRVVITQLIRLAEEWRDGPNGNKYQGLYIRTCNSGQLGVGFSYKLEGQNDYDLKRAYDKYLNDMKAALKARFGKDLLGWDIGRRTWVVK